MHLDNKPKIIDLAAFVFHAGAHRVPLADVQREIAALHDEERAKLEESSVRREKPLEAVIEKLEWARPRVDAAWTDLLKRLGHHAPPVASAILIAFLGCAALAIDAILLGPGLDSVGIADPVVQLIAAFGLAALSSLIFHLALESFERNSLTLETRIIRRSAGGTAVFALLAWGVFRGLQVKFGADINQNPLGQFLGDHPVLAAIFFSFLTLTAPLAGALALHHSAPRLYEWLNWKRARQAHETLHTELSDALKKLDTERATLGHELKQLDARQQIWHATAAQYHERGQVHGARQTPHWLVLLKSTGWSLGGLVVGCVTGPHLTPLYFALPAGTWIAAFLYYRHQRFHPSYEAFSRLANTQFAISSERTQTIQPDTRRYLPKSGNKR